MPLNIRDLAITAPAFGEGGAMPERFTQDADDVSPELRFAGVPGEAVELALICHDPDAPLPDGFTHWVLYGIPPHVEVLEEGSDQYTSGANDSGDEGYRGPRPPEGHGPHRYYFWLYALDSRVDAPPGLTRTQLMDRIRDHIIEQNRVVGVYER